MVISGITFLNAIKHRLELCLMYHLQHKLPTTTGTSRYTNLEQHQSSKRTDINCRLPLINDSYMTSNANERHQQPIDRSNSKTATNTNHCNFQVSMTNHISKNLISPNHGQRHSTIILTLKMTTTYVVEPSVTNTSLSEDDSHPDNH